MTTGVYCLQKAVVVAGNKDFSVIACYANIINFLPKSKLFANYLGIRKSAQSWRGLRLVAAGWMPVGLYT